ncbi:hypothetical protein D044_4791B, partial [Vibrio parahaemolyticus EKP-026]
QVVIPSIISPR